MKIFQLFFSLLNTEATNILTDGLFTTIVSLKRLYPRKVSQWLEYVDEISLISSSFPFLTS